jgi:mannose-1-phosphate guanylyltransferase
VQKSVENAERDCEFTSLEQESFEKSQNISVDYAVMEKTDKGCVVEIDAQWNDIGSWDAVCDISEKDENNNVSIGDTLEEDSFNNFIYSKDKLLVTLGVDNMTIINTPDAILIASKYHANEVKKVVDRLKDMKRKEVEYHAKSDTPWGTSNILHQGSMSEVKRLSVKPGAKVQSIDHAYQSEHWIILKGQAQATSRTRSEILSRDDSIHVEQGAIYTFENIGDGDLEIIQIKTGDGVEESNVMKING